MLKGTIEREVRRYKEEYSPIKRELPENLNIAKFVDHTLLKADATPKMVEKLCEEAIRFEFWSVCVNTGYLPLVNRSLSGSTIRKTVVIGFPLGQMSREVKGFETSWACDNGADEFDMVINVGLLKSGEYESVFDDIAKVVESARGKTVKVIIETSLLSEEEKIVACVISREAGAAFVKTSTGFSGGGATVDDVSLMKFVVGDACKVKASGGVKSREEALAMISAGASRIGTSSGINIVSDESKENRGGY
ncbi:deoxyribose-phosphate aldolase [Mesotoga sp. H07pep.5.4]|uniref:deoxyribose-phosphate aldolase n=1 Tax=unclassified Mesotoga TaxID=1184398 RepID=UPI000C174526|nr:MULTISPECIES: deoxyribose-phosphate aldolase [unclassified Mesotoga]PIJ62097.1 deoxyribose-phosphate aldolase [Mesotoga sp. H07.pep.5.3]RLL88440.1 deoxyribose-phosphate aldolase [Mesotoga sp. H07pep.5.4]